MSNHTLNLFNLLVNIYNYPVNFLLAYLNDCKTDADKYAFCQGVIKLEEQGFNLYKCTCNY